MRLNKLGELIHNSSNQNNLKFARVSIIFKEIKETIDEKVVIENSFELTREVYKNSSSKYYFNKKETSFDLICEVLQKKGIDLKHKRFLILQGEVEQIAMMKPKSTNKSDIGILEYLEDIIGTSRYIKLINKLTMDIESLGEIKSKKFNLVNIAKAEINQLEDVKNASLEYYRLEKLNLIMINLTKNIQKHNLDNKINGLKEIIGKLEDKNILCGKEISHKLKENDHVIEQHRIIRNKQELLIKKKEQFIKQTEDYDEIDKEKRAECEFFKHQISKNKNIVQKLNKIYTEQIEEFKNSSKNLPIIESNVVKLLEVKKSIEKYISDKEQNVIL